YLFLIVQCSLNTCGPRAIVSSDSYPLDHSPVVIELLFGTLSVPVTPLSLRSTDQPIILSRCPDLSEGAESDNKALQKSYPWTLFPLFDTHN
ncbi:hypothetical protein HETIRDRAFT_322248, partial [Heterobasidion irregulare TC 32-1]